MSLLTISHPDPAILAKLEAGLRPEVIDVIIERVALKTFTQVVENTPKKWFGQLRRAWTIRKPGIGARVVVNTSKMMRWIEDGTKDHGPVRAKALFIPLTKRAMMAYMTGTKLNVATDIQTRKPLEALVFGKGRMKRRILVRRGKGTSVSLKYGVDYILVKRVRGIQARRIVAKQREATAQMLLSEFKNHINNIINA